jgi:hypothetical protein
VAIAFLVLPYVITTSTTIVDNQAAATSLKTLQEAQAYVPNANNPSPPSPPPNVVSALEDVGAPGKALVIFLHSYPDNYAATHNFTLAELRTVSQHPDIIRQLTGLTLFVPIASAISSGEQVSTAKIQAVAKASPELAALLETEQKLVPAQKAAPPEWRRWWWVCVGGQVFFLVVVFFIPGRWRPAAARRDVAEHERKVDEELAKLAEDLTRSEGVQAVG